MFLKPEATNINEPNLVAPRGVERRSVSGDPACRWPRPAEGGLMRLPRPLYLGRLTSAVSSRGAVWGGWERLGAAEIVVPLAFPLV
jgi:hypothetical protein